MQGTWLFAWSSFWLESAMLTVASIIHLSIGGYWLSQLRLVARAATVAHAVGDASCLWSGSGQWMLSREMSEYI